MRTSERHERKTTVSVLEWPPRLVWRPGRCAWHGTGDPAGPARRGCPLLTQGRRRVCRARTPGPSFGLVCREAHGRRRSSSQTVNLSVNVTHVVVQEVV